MIRYREDEGIRTEIGKGEGDEAVDQIQRRKAPGDLGV